MKCAKRQGIYVHAHRQGASLQRLFHSLYDFVRVFSRFTDQNTKAFFLFQCIQDDGKFAQGSAIAKEGNTVVVPANAGDAGAMVAQAMGIFKAMDGRGGGRGGAGGDGGGGGVGEAAAAATDAAEELPADDMASWRLAAEERAQRPEGLEEEQAKLDEGFRDPK